MSSQTQALTPHGGSGQVAASGRTIKDLLQGPELKSAVKAALPKHLTPERFIRVALNATMRQPELLSCSRESFFRALLDLSALGLEADGRRAHLIPFRNKGQMEVQLIIDYKGIAELVRRSGDVSYIHADVVYEHDEFEYSFGSGAALKHKPNLEDRGERVVAVYSFVKLKDGSEDFIVLSKSDVDKVRKRSRAANNGPWVSDWDEMAKKTAFRRHSKWLPLSPETRDAVEKDDEISGAQMADALQAATAAISIDSLKPSADENRGHDATAPQADEPEQAEAPKPCTTKPPSILDDSEEFDGGTLLWQKVKGVVYHLNSDGKGYHRH
ncbi:MAG TPA: recombinase RecT [Bryobacteraceae bacterium]|nr:recombinase RecT [Bryobacteraceae bacterium]